MEDLNFRGPSQETCIILYEGFEGMIRMLALKKRYVVNEKQEPVAVQIDLATWRKIEEALEDHLLGKRMREAGKEAPMIRERAFKYYARLKKKGKA